MKMMLDFYTELRELTFNRKKVNEDSFCTLRVKVTNFEEETNFINAIYKMPFVENYEIWDSTYNNYYTDMILIDVNVEEYFKLYSIFENIFYYVFK